MSNICLVCFTCFASFFDTNYLRQLIEKHPYNIHYTFFSSYNFPKILFTIEKSV